MAKQEEKLFSIEPDQDNAKGKTWKDRERDNARKGLHELGVFNHRDDLGLETTGQIRAETEEGKSRPDALRWLTAQAARRVMDERFKENDRAREAAAAEREQAKNKEIEKLLSDPTGKAA